MMRMLHFEKSPPSPSFSKRGTEGGISLFLFFLIYNTAYCGDLAQKVQEAYRNTPALEADFVQKTYVELLEKEVVEKGTLVLAKPGRFRISYHGKRERAYISDGKKLWIIHPGEKEVIDDISSQVSPEALTFLGGLGEMERDFQVTEQSSGKKGKLTLIPRREDSPFKKIVLTIDPKLNLVREAELFPKNGNKSLYRFEKMVAKNDVSGALFHP